MDVNLAFLGAGLAIGLAGLGVALGEARVASTSLEVLGKNPNLSKILMIYTVIGIALVESSAIYGLIVAFNIIGNPDVAAVNALAAGLAVGLTGFGVGYGEGMLVSNGLDAVNRNPENANQVLQYMIVFIALVETAAIYGLVVAFQLLG